MPFYLLIWNNNFTLEKEYNHHSAHRFQGKLFVLILFNKFEAIINYGQTDYQALIYCQDLIDSESI